MDFTKPDWLDNWQPLQEFATSSLTDLNLSYPITNWVRFFF
jgi:hypothetical protein